MLPAALIEWVPWTREWRSVWDSTVEESERLWLLRPDELPKCPDGTVLTTISGGTATVGVDKIDGDTRGGLLAYGLKEYQLPPFQPSRRGEWESE